MGGVQLVLGLVDFLFDGRKWSDVLWLFERLLTFQKVLLLGAGAVPFGV